MELLQVHLFFVFLVYLCCREEVLCQAHGNVENYGHGINRGYHFHQKQNEPCEVCPRQGRCVPKVMCPAHLRPNSLNVLCHIRGQRGMVGVCCFTGSGHAGETDYKLRTSTAISPDEIKKAHKESKKKFEDWMRHTDQLLRKASEKAIVNETSPSFGHHLSMMTYDGNATILGEGALLNLFAAQELKARDAISDEDLNLDFTEHTEGPYCPPAIPCPEQPSRYRPISGECNNPSNPSWGAVNTGYERLLPPHYSDGLWAFRTSVLGLPLPSARAVSSNLILDLSIPSEYHNLMFMQFGQFIGHDVSAGVAFTIGNGSAISCCVGEGEDFLPIDERHWACAPIEVPNHDDFYHKFEHKCMNFVRTQLAPASDCSVGYAKQMNGATHYLDLSQLYGNNLEKCDSLRAERGLLKTFTDYGRELPPLTARKECVTSKDGAACFESGDNHGNQVISLTVLHTIFTREHNRLVRALNALNPDWSEDTLFLEARRILQAEVQNILYNEWLPILLGPRLTQMFDLLSSPGYSSSYDPRVNPALTAEFAVAAMRFGHSAVDSKLVVPYANTDNLYEAISLPEVMFQPSRLRIRPFLDRIISGLTWQSMQTIDPFVSESLTRYLFHGGNPFGLDLASINIQRGRDYGLRSYNDYKKLVGLEAFTDFSQYPPYTAARLSSVYESPEDIDLWVGGLLEDPVEGGVVGETFANIIADQFSRFKRGDRYYYENSPSVNPGAFTPSQLAEIKKVTLSRILCDNRDGFELQKLPPHAFVKSTVPGNEPVYCDSAVIPSMDLNRFKDV